MIDYACFCQMKHLHTHEGLNASQIAKTLTLDPRTVSHWLAQEHFRPRKPRQSPSKLDPFKPELVRLLERYPYWVSISDCWVLSGVKFGRPDFPAPARARL